ALRGRAGIQWADGGYTLLAATFTDQEAAEDHALALHRDGYRAGIMVDKKAGASTAYRVVVGQFGDADAAVTGRQEMLRNNRPGAWMVITLDSETTTVE